MGPSVLDSTPAWRVEVHRREGVHDPDGARALEGCHELGIESVRAVRTGRGWLLDPRADAETVRSIARDVLVDPVLDEVRITPPDTAPEPRDGHRVLVARKPGVMNPEARTVESLLARSGHTAAGERLRVESYRAYEIDGSPTAAELEEISSRLLANETIESVRVDREDLSFAAPAAHARRGRVDVALRALGAEQLVELSRDGQLSLTEQEMLAIQAHFEALDREPTACELETLAQTWSEHCKHKTLTGVVEYSGPDGTRRIDNLLKSTIVAATNELDRDFCISVFVDNAGIVAFDDDWGLCFKVETHNHPSAIDPYGGAGTGIGGVIRDILGAGLGAKPIANTDAFFVGPLDLPREELPKGSLHPRRVLRGVVSGVRDYGNRMGIPTVNGGVWFHERYVGNPLVYAGTVGLIPRDRVEKRALPGDVIVSAGGRTGLDGIHGATFSSAELHEESESLAASAVQIGDPVTEKQVLDCQLVARDRGLYRCVTDCGAGGFSSAIGEMGEETGADVVLDDALLKYPGLASHEIWISEAQERMVFAVPLEHLDAFLAIFAAEDVETCVLGRFTDTRRLVVRDQGEVICDLPMAFLHDGTPRPVRQATWEPPRLADPGCPVPDDWNGALLELLASPDVCSREWIVRQYDHEVQGASVVKPLVGPGGDGPGDAAVLQPVATSRRGVALAMGACPRAGLLDPRAMALAAIDEALRNAVCVGADPDEASILDNFSWGNCDKPDRMGAMVLAAEACRDAALAYRTPFISGKDSLNNEYRVGGETISIPPTLLISCMAIVPDVARATTMDAKAAGNRLYAVGATRPELGGSAWHALRGVEGGAVAQPDLEQAPRTLRALAGAIAGGHVRACHDLSEGGLAVAVAEMAFAGGLGAEVDLARLPGADLASDPADGDAERLFAESCTRFLVEVEDAHAAAFEAALADCDCAAIGTWNDTGRLAIRGSDGTPRIELALDELRAAHAGGFRG